MFLLMLKEYYKDKIAGCHFILKIGEMVIFHVLDACFFYYFLYNRKNDNAERRNK